jgi:hypothetical protein
VTLGMHSYSLTDIGCKIIINGIFLELIIIGGRTQTNKSNINVLFLYKHKQYKRSNDTKQYEHSIISKGLIEPRILIMDLNNT